MVAVNIDSKWMHWLKDNLARGSHPAELAQIIADNFSVSIAKATSVVEKAKTWQPTTQSAQATHNQQDASNNQMKRREWMMRSLDSLQQLDPNYLSIEKIVVPPLAEFVSDFYARNKPVMFENAFTEWPASHWTPQHLVEVIGDKSVEVQVNRESNPRFEMDSLKHKQHMLFSEYHQKVQNAGASNDFYMTANNAKQNQTVLAPLFEDIGNIGEDYFDTSLHSTRSFIWYGPKGNYTPLHHDETNNMFLQVYGRKRFLLVPPLQTPYLYNETAVFSPVDLRSIDEQMYSLAKRTTPIEVTLNPGDTLFIPLGWWHQVESLDISISISMTNFNLLNRFPN